MKIKPKKTNFSIERLGLSLILISLVGFIIWAGWLIPRADLVYANDLLFLKALFLGLALLVTLITGLYIWIGKGRVINI